MPITNIYRFAQGILKQHGNQTRVPFIPNSFGLCIDQIENFILQTRAEMHGPTIEMHTLLLFIYADDVVLFAHDIASLQKLVDVMHAFCKNTRFSINVDKMKFMLVRTHKENQLTLMYQGKQTERVDNFNYLGIDIPSNYA